MKQTTNFPYDVDVTTINLVDLPHEIDYFKYEVNLPDYYIMDDKFTDVNDNIDIIAEINCSATMYRKVFATSDDLKLIITIPRDKVSLNFTVDVLLVSNKEFEWDSQILQKGMPIAHFGSFKKDIDNRSTGLISFETSESNELFISTSDHTIKIKIPKKQYEFLLKKQNSLLIKKVLTSQFAQIALLEACKELKGNSKRDNLIWYKELLNRWRKFSGSDEDYPQETDHLRFVQDLLEKPSIKLIDYLIAEEKQNQDE
ncbi:hypothetical protein [Winogradskyella helgolandensis]|uniref:hypothetical protein n=1 Tax=Winogradskyella helgolandensis TaxID=2697010 RepID=UPI0015CD7DEC|nr:hypothetical protein [Winogradskyella helgolandensis]